MAGSLRIHFFVGLAVLGLGSAATAQSQPAVGADDQAQPAAETPPPADTPVPAETPSPAKTLGPTRSQATNSHFGRTTTMRRAPGSSSAPGVSAAGGAGRSATVGRKDVARPNPEGVPKAERPASLGTSRQPQAAMPARTQTGRDYYPGLRGGRHPNANVGQVRRQRMGTGMGMGMGMGMGGRSSMPGRVASPAHASGRGR